MAGPQDFNFEEAIHGVLETRTALDRASAVTDRLEKLLSENPAAFAPLAAAAFRLRDRLIEDLGTLEAGLAQAQSTPAPAAQTYIGKRASIAEELGVSQGDVRALGGE